MTLRLSSSALLPPLGGARLFLVRLWGAFVPRICIRTCLPAQVPRVLHGSRRDSLLEGQQIGQFELDQ
jgi:hypothetical protein